MLAAVAEFGVDAIGRSLDLVLEHAGRLGDDHRRLIRLQLLLQHPLRLIQIERIDLADPLDADSPA